VLSQAADGNTEVQEKLQAIRRRYEAKVCPLVPSETLPHIL
jgi:hypothetical protein